MTQNLLLQRKSRTFKISNKKIEILKNEMTWEGTGSELDPIIIDQVVNFPFVVKIYRSSLYYHIKNLTIDKLTCRNAQNVTIENCTIKRLKINGCKNLTLINNTVLKLKIVMTRGCTFIDNKFAQIPKLKKGYYTNQGKVNPLMCCLYFTTISIIVSGTPIWFIGLFPLGLLLYLNYHTYMKYKRIRDKPDNTYINNLEI